MNTETFNNLLDELDDNSLETLKQKNAKYASPDDCLHNFDSGAEIMGGTPAQCAWGYMTKHLTALRDKVEKNDFRDRNDLLEKCQDIINYIRFIWLIGNEERINYTKSENTKYDDPIVEKCISNCKFYCDGKCTGTREMDPCNYKPLSGCRYYDMHGHKLANQTFPVMKECDIYGMD